MKVFTAAALTALAICSRSNAEPAHQPQPTASGAVDAGAVRAKAAAYLRSKQDSSNGSWGVVAGAPVFPAITALALRGVMNEPGVSADDPAVANAIEFILSHQQPDGGIYDQALPSYNTAICISALAAVDRDDTREAVKKAVVFLKSLQFTEAAITHEGLAESAKPVTKDNPFYGGWGYGRHGRPDLSNTGMALQALHDAHLGSEDPAFQRALVFLQRTQMLNTTADGAVVNDQAYAAGSRQGGFVYSTSENRDRVGSGQSMASAMIEETLSDGAVASRLRAYGSMSYTGFKSYLYAGLTKDDPRVAAAKGWIESNYTLDENPGVGTDGLYYYYVVFSSALDAAGDAVIRTRDAQGATTGERRWREELAAKLASLQQGDGSFKVVDDRWMENNPVLITAYGLLALQSAAE